MTPLVSLDVLPADVPAEYAPAMVAACSEALAEGRCAMASELPDSTQPETVALVQWQGEGFLQVTVRVGRLGSEWAARTLAFSEHDSISERWTTVGLTVATLVGESRALDSAPPSEARPAMTPPAPTRPLAAAPPPSKASSSVQSASQPASWLVGVGALVGAGWDGGDSQRGGWLALTYRVPGWPFQAHASSSYALGDGPTMRGERVLTRWLMAGIGAGVFGTYKPLSVTGSAALELGYRSIEVDFQGRTAGDQELPVRLRAVASAPATGVLAGTLGLLLRLPARNSNANSAWTLRSAAIAWEAVAGLEVRL